MSTKIHIPSHEFIEIMRRKTEENDHNGARCSVSGWLMRQLHEHGCTIADSDLRKAVSFYRVFEAIATIHAEIGHLPLEVYELRHRRTEEMLEFIEKSNPEAADAIRKAL